MIVALLLLQLVLYNVQGKHLLIETGDGYKSQNSEVGIQLSEIFMLFSYKVSLWCVSLWIMCFV